MSELLNEYIWLLKQWWFWVAVVAGNVIYWYLFRQRVYKQVNDKFCIRHGRLGKWLDVEEHLKTEHPIEYAILKKTQDEANERKRQG